MSMIGASGRHKDQTRTEAGEHQLVRRRGTGSVLAGNLCSSHRTHGKSPRISSDRCFAPRRADGDSGACRNSFTGDSRGRGTRDSIWDWRRAYHANLLSINCSFARIGFVKMNALQRFGTGKCSPLGALLTIQRSLIISLSYLSSHPSLRLSGPDSGPTLASPGRYLAGPR